MVAQDERSHFNPSIFQQRQPLLCLLQGHANPVYALSVDRVCIHHVCFQLTTV